MQTCGEVQLTQPQRGNNVVQSPGDVQEQCGDDASKSIRARLSFNQGTLSMVEILCLGSGRIHSIGDG